MRISKRAYPDIDIAELTEDDAKAIYQRDYWECAPIAMPCPGRFGWMLFDCAVKPRRARGHKMATGRFISLPVDECWAAYAYRRSAGFRPGTRRPRHHHRRDEFAATLSNYPTFKHGWKKRFLNTLIGAAQWIQAS